MKKILLAIIPFFLFLCSINYVNAGTANFSLSGSTNVAPGQSFSLQLVANGSGGINGLTGSYSFNGNNCVSLESVEELNKAAIVGQKITYNNYDASGSPAVVAFVKLNFKAISASCTASISFNSLKGGFVDNTSFNTRAEATIRVSAPLSANNNLASLTTDQGMLSPSFNKDITNYNISVKQDVASININATKEDNGATITGLGNKKLNYGANKFTITVKAENGSTKNYIVTVNREDERSNDATLKSISINNGTLSPSFNSSTMDYNIEVPYEVSKLNINAVANDSKAKVSVSNPDLVEEETTKVTIKVTAENGSTKTYTINVKRGKNPNKVLNTDNKLLSLTPSIGILSPVFSSDTNNYFIYLPYEVEEISFEYEISDKKYGKVEESKIDKLVPNSANKFSFTVTAEDESTNVYTVTVNRAKNPEELGSNNVKIKELILHNGKLFDSFDSDITTYQYKKSKEFSLEVVLEDENATYKIIEQENSIYIIVEAPNGDIGIYCLHEKKTNKVLIILVIIIIILVLALTYLLVKKVLKNKATKKVKK